MLTLFTSLCHSEQVTGLGSKQNNSKNLWRSYFDVNNGGHSNMRPTNTTTYTTTSRILRLSVTNCQYYSHTQNDRCREQGRDIDRRIVTSFVFYNKSNHIKIPLFLSRKDSYSGILLLLGYFK